MGWSPFAIQYRLVVYGISAYVMVYRWMSRQRHRQYAAIHRVALEYRPPRQANSTVRHARRVLPFPEMPHHNEYFMSIEMAW